MNKFFNKLVNILLILIIILILANISNFLLSIFAFIGKIILPFFLGFVIAYIMNPLVNILEKYLKKRKYAVFVTILLIVLILFFIVKGIYPILYKELSSLFNNLPNIFENLKNELNKFSKFFTFLPEDNRPNADNIIDMIGKFLSNSHIKINNIVGSLLSFFSILVVTPVVTIYILIDFNNIKNGIKGLLIKKNKNRLLDYLKELNTFSSKYVKTTFIVMIIMIILSSVTFTILKLDYPLFFGFIVGITNVIPYVGPYIGGAFPVLYSLSLSNINTFYVLLSIIIIQLIESNIISPYLHSKRSETHPLLVLISLSLFGSLFGVLGMLFAVPLFKFFEITLKHYPLKLNKN